jgi:hypothetical protein
LNYEYDDEVVAWRVLNSSRNGYIVFQQRPEYHYANNIPVEELVVRKKIKDDIR